MSESILHRCETCGSEFTPRNNIGRFCRYSCVRWRKQDLSRFFEERVDKNGPVLRQELGPCHIWVGQRSQRGYGIAKVGSRADNSRRKEFAHRIAWFLGHGRWPEPCCLHKCDGGPIGCVRLDHLFEGTQLDNIRDMIEKGRAVYPPRAREKAARMANMASQACVIGQTSVNKTPT